MSEGQRSRARRPCAACACLAHACLFESMTPTADSPSRLSSAVSRRRSSLPGAFFLRVDACRTPPASVAQRVQGETTDPRVQGVRIRRPVTGDRLGGVGGEGPQGRTQFARRPDAPRAREVSASLARCGPFPPRDGHLPAVLPDPAVARAQGSRDAPSRRRPMHPTPGERGAAYCVLRTRAICLLTHRTKFRRHATRTWERQLAVRLHERRPSPGMNGSTAAAAAWRSHRGCSEPGRRVVLREHVKDAGAVEADRAETTHGTGGQGPRSASGSRGPVPGGRGGSVTTRPGGKGWLPQNSR